MNQNTLHNRLTDFLQRLKSYFSLHQDKMDEQATIDAVSSDVSFRGANLYVLIFAIFIASLGLNVNSTAVIIGAMLVSPLMGPIVGMGLAIGIGNIELLKRAFKNFLVATVISIVTATLYFWISPLGDVQSELLARTTPTLYDVLIAFFGGCAGIVAIASGGKGNVIPGVAIATALMPPLCTAGFGIATGNLSFFLGAFYLFCINTVFIALATTLGVRLMGFRRTVSLDQNKARKAHRIMVSIVVIILIPAVFMTVSIVRGSIFNNNLTSFIKEEFDLPGSRIIEHEVSKDEHTLQLVSVGNIVDEETIDRARHNMEHYGLGAYELRFIQLNLDDNGVGQSNRTTGGSVAHYRDALQLQQQRSDSLQAVLQPYKQVAVLAVPVERELQTLFPEVSTLDMAYVSRGVADSMQGYVVAVVATQPKALSAKQQASMHQWLAQRLECDSVRLVMTNGE